MSVTLVRVAIIETVVLGAIAYHARCLECKWESKRFDGKRGELKAIVEAELHLPNVCPASAKMNEEVN